MLCIKCCPSSSNFSWHNVLLYNPLLNKNAGDTFTLKEKVNHYSKKAVDMEASKIKKGKSRTRPVEMKKILGGGLRFMKYCGPPWLADEENFSFQIV